MPPGPSRSCSCCAHAPMLGGCLGEGDELCGSWLSRPHQNSCTLPRICQLWPHSDLCSLTPEALEVIPATGVGGGTTTRRAGPHLFLNPSAVTSTRAGHVGGFYTTANATDQGGVGLLLC